MSSIYRAFKFAKEQPLGCLGSLLFSAIMTTTAIGAIGFAAYSLIAVSAFKSAIADATGFHMSADSILFNLYNGKCSISRVILDNPSAYDVHNISSKLNFENEPLIIANRIEMQISPSDLIFNGKIKLISISLDIEKLNCIRINNNTYNLSEFIDGIRPIMAANEENGSIFLSDVSVKIKWISYRDISNSRDALYWNLNANIDYSDKSVDNISELFSKLDTRFKEANVPFINKSIFYK